MGSSLSTPSRPPVPSYTQQTLSTASKRKAPLKQATQSLRISSAPQPGSSPLVPGGEDDAQAEAQVQAEAERARRASRPPERESSTFDLLETPTGLKSSLLSPPHRTFEDDLPPFLPSDPPHEDEDETSSRLSSPPPSPSPSPLPPSRKRKQKKRKTAAEKAAYWKEKQAAADNIKATRSNVCRGAASPLKLKK